MPRGGLGVSEERAGQGAEGSAGAGQRGRRGPGRFKGQRSRAGLLRMVRGVGKSTLERCGLGAKVLSDVRVSLLRSVPGALEGHGDLETCCNR
jgi:hypothetical protein